MEQGQIIQNGQFSTTLFEPQDLTERDVSAWKSLESRAIEANAFLSPNFVIPAIRHLESRSKNYILTINKNSAGSSDLVGLFAFKVSNFSKLFPLPHLSAFHSRHSFLTSILADQDYAPDVVKIVFQHLFKLFPHSYGIAFEEHLAQGSLAELEKDIASQFGMIWVPFMQWNRSVLYPSQLEGEGTNHLSKRLLKNSKHCMRGLSEQGKVDWEIIHGNGITSVNVDEFIRLENMGWKGKAQTSLLSKPNHLLFFREMIQNFSRDSEAFFTELRLNDKIIASTSNLTSGNVGFAFKIGWDEAYAKCSVGTLNEIMLLRCNDSSFKKLKYVDSGTSGDSYINRMWPGKTQVHTGIYIHSKMGKLISASLRSAWYPSIHFAKNIKHKLIGH
jgi:hypothetical protein